MKGAKLQEQKLSMEYSREKKWYNDFEQTVVARIKDRTKTFLQS